MGYLEDAIESITRLKAEKADLVSALDGLYVWVRDSFKADERPTSLMDEAKNALARAGKEHDL
jgi:hypothetical protein